MTDRPNHPSGLHAFVARGPNTGTLLYPHQYRDGAYVVSPTKYDDDYTRVTDEAALLGWLTKGYCLRMSNEDGGVPSPSLIEPSKIYRQVVK